MKRQKRRARKPEEKPKYWEQIEEGRNAPPGSECPYGYGLDVGKRCAWMAGYTDSQAAKRGE